MRFQTEKAQAIVFTVDEAISLHQGEHGNTPRVMLLHDVRWTARQLAQIEGRCHRDGTLAPVMWLAGEGTVELEIAQVMADRMTSMKAMVGDDTSDEQAISEAIQRALSRALSKAG